LRILLAGGGTAGHLSPGIAVAQRLREQDPQAQVEFVCSTKPLDADMLTQADLPCHPLPMVPFPYSLTPQAAYSLTQLLRSLGRAYRLMRPMHLQAVLGIGGYISVPVIMAARLLRIPVAIHVLDAEPDRANRLVGRWARWITVAFAQAAAHFPARRTEVTGCPVRREIEETSRAEGQEKLRLDPTRFTLLVMGGSHGARQINQALVGALPTLISQGPVQVVHITGPTEYDQVVAATTGMANGHERYHPLPFAKEMWLPLAAADLVISRAGASSVAECSARGLPQILVPYPYAGGHQRANAEALARVGGAVVVPDEKCTASELIRHVTALVEDDLRRQEMGQAAAAWASPQAAARIAAGLLSLSRKPA